MSDSVENTEKHIGRPLEYTKEMGDRICELVSTHDCGLKRLCQMYPELPDKMTINRWRYRVESFRGQYALAKMQQADLLAEECLEIADDSSGDSRFDPETGFEVCNAEYIARSRLRIDTRKWLAAKLLPKQYGQESAKLTEKAESLIEKVIDKLTEE